MRYRWLLTLLAALAVFSLTAGEARAALCNVPTLVYATIQSAVADGLCTTIKVANGSYTGPITIGRSLTLSGGGLATIIKPPPGPMAEPKAIIQITGGGVNVTVQNFAIRGPGTGPSASLRYGIVVDGGARALIQNNGLSAIRDQPLGGAQTGIAILVRSGVSGTVIAHNTFADYQKGAIVVDDAGSGATISGNFIQGDGLRFAPIAAQNGIQVSDGATADILTNQVLDHRYDEISFSSTGILVVQAGVSVIVRQNTVARNDVGIWGVSANSSRIEGNVVRDSTFDGISLDSEQIPLTTANSNIVQNNQVAFNDGPGISLYSANSNHIANNLFAGNGNDGILVNTSGSNVFVSNNSRENGFLGIFDDNSLANTYSGNVCSANGTGKSLPPGLC